MSAHRYSMNNEPPRPPLPPVLAGIRANKRIDSTFPCVRHSGDLNQLHDYGHALAYRCGGSTRWLLLSAGVGSVFPV
ncbi:MAG: hypothetical protein RI962_958 [Pseudomonadota bacterium]|jgi:hypothetical protein